MVECVTMNVTGDMMHSEIDSEFRACDRMVQPRRIASLPGGNSEWEPPDPISNSEVKTLCADGSVAFGHARVGHCQALKSKPPVENRPGVCSFGERTKLTRECALASCPSPAGGSRSYGLKLRDGLRLPPLLPRVVELRRLESIQEVVGASAGIATPALGASADRPSTRVPRARHRPC